MDPVIHRDLIEERLEMARTLGLVTRYLIRPPGAGSGSEASIRVWRSAGAAEETVRDYLVRLLAGLVPGRHVVVAPAAEEPMAASAERLGRPRLAAVPAAA